MRLLGRSIPEGPGVLRADEESKFTQKEDTARVSKRRALPKAIQLEQVLEDELPVHTGT